MFFFFFPDDFTKPLPGALCLFTLKNPSFPEYIRLTDFGLLTVSIHPKEAYLMAVGGIDGTLSIYNKNLLTKAPQYQSDSVNKHLGAIWQVRIAFYFIIIMRLFSHKKTNE